MVIGDFPAKTTIQTPYIYGSGHKLYIYIYDSCHNLVMEVCSVLGRVVLCLTLTALYFTVEALN
jgi:hypothetical protein